MPCNRKGISNMERSIEVRTLPLQRNTNNPQLSEYPNRRRDCRDFFCPGKFRPKKSAMTIGNVTEPRAWLAVLLILLLSLRFPSRVAALDRHFAMFFKSCPTRDGEKLCFVLISFVGKMKCRNLFQIKVCGNYH